MLRKVTLLAMLVAGSLLAESAAGASSASLIQSAAPPAGFDELTRPREMLLDVYYGDRKVGEARAVVAPGTVRFIDPATLIALVPDVIPSPALTAELSSELPSHPELVCSPGNSGQCGELAPETVGVILDEDHFRASLFFAPKLLRTRPAVGDPYLKPSTGPLSLTSNVGLALSGSTGTSAIYNIQDRTILSLGNARIRSDFSYASRLGLTVDNLVGEIERRDLRYSAGLFWAPGLDLTGQRRIAGIGAGTQFDTRADRELIEGTPLVLFLQQPSRVEMIVEGRLVTSRSYGAGNNVLDTSALPDGSYPVTLRIRQENGGVREEQRFFVKNAQIAPAGQTLLLAYAGMLANSEPHHPISISDNFYYQVGAARRLSRSIAVDLSAVGAAGKNMIEAGGWLVTRHGKVRVAGLVSTKGDKGALVQFGSSGQGPLNFNLDVRRVWSSDGRPLIPLPAFIDSFGTTPPTGAQVGQSSYTQVSGSLGYSLGRAYVSVIGSLRHDRGFRTDYTVGPNLNWPIFSKDGMEIVLQADAQRTRTTTAAFAGLRFQLNSSRLSFLATAGEAVRHTDGGSDSDVSRAVGSLSAEYFHESADRTQVSANAGFERSLDTSDIHAGAAIYSRLGSARGDLLHPLEGRGGLQYGLTLQSGAALDRHELALGGRDIQESALVVSLDGERGRTAFDVLVDDQPRGRLVAGQSVPIFLQPYRSYQVRIRPAGPTSVDYDTGTRSVVLYPGNVAHVRWAARSLFTVFGQAVGPDGRPIANAMVRSERGIGETNDEGYFQIDVAGGDTLSFTRGQSLTCHSKLGTFKEGRDLVPLGKVTCE